MRRFRLPTLLAGLGAAVITSMFRPAGAVEADRSWDPARVGHTIADARQARQEGDLNAAERLCHDAFESVDSSALAAYDAYADLLHVEHRVEEATVRGQSERLHAVKVEQRRSTRPSSTYLGFAPAEGLKAYADLLASLQQRDDAQHIRSLALAYQQVQQAHFQRTTMFRQGQDRAGHADPAASCSARSQLSILTIPSFTTLAHLRAPVRALPSCEQPLAINNRAVPPGCAQCPPNLRRVCAAGRAIAPARRPAGESTGAG